MNLSDSFGSWLKQQRKALDWTQPQLAEKVGCSIALIRKLESDERRPSKQIVGILCDIVDIPTGEREVFLAYARGKTRLNTLPPNNLPLDQTPFIGRKSDLELLQSRFMSRECRLLVLTGPGGIGKTRLAIQAARHILPEFQDGVFLVSLVGVDSIEYLVSSIAAALSLSFHGLADLKTQLLHYLRDRILLLIIDNYEHLLPQTDLIIEILQAVQHVKILVTSREPLKVQEEWVFPVGGLSYPKHLTKDLSGFETIQLFEQRAVQANSRVVLAETDKPFVARICELTQGMPLAIEMAAAWVRLLSCQEIAEAVQSNWDFPSSKLQNVPERHRSMSAVFEYSWKRLPQEEQTAFMKLSIFRGGFTQEAARGVADVTLDALANLIDKSFIVRGANGRYAIHELLRQYGEAKLAERPDERDQTYEKFTTYYCSLLNSVREGIWLAEHIACVEQVGNEIDNIRYVWTLATMRGTWTALDQLWEPMWFYYNDTNLFQEGYIAFSQSVAHLKSAALHPKYEIILAAFSKGQAWFALRMGRPLEAKGLVDESLMLLEASKLHDARTEVHIFVCTIYILCALGRNTEAKPYGYRCLAIGHQAGSEMYTSAGHFALGMVFRALRDYGSAKTHLRKAVRFAKHNGFLWALAYFLYELGRVELALKNFKSARTFLEESIDLFEAYNDYCNAAEVLVRLSSTLFELGQKERAAICCYKSLRISVDAEAVPVTIDALVDIARLLVDISALPIAFDILKAVQSHPATTQEAHARIDSMLDNMSKIVSPIPAAVTRRLEKPGDLQQAITLALKAESLLVKLKPGYRETAD